MKKEAAREKKNILVVAAHPDDEVLGCGATIVKLRRQGHAVYALILGEGITSRDAARDVKKRGQGLINLKRQAKAAAAVLGLRELFFCDYPDNRFDTVALLDIVKSIERIKDKIKPDLVFTHYERDLNVDHQITYKAVLTAMRPRRGETVKEIYSFEVPSSTEVNYPVSYSPNVFYDITDTIDVKIKALKLYKGELKQYPHSRSIKGIEILAQYRGTSVNVEYAEAFQLIRLVK